MTIEEWLGKDNKLGIDIWNRKYKQKDEDFDGWLDRISGGNEEIKQYIIEKKFLFGGRILANRGLDKKGKKVTYSNCYVIDPPEDNLESIFDCAKKLARTYSYSGGCGIDISKLAPRGAKINNAANATTGAVSFMDLYSLVTGLIGQNGRRGALMISMDCSHPDIEEFIKVKTDLEKVTKANISIRFSDAFMPAVKNDTDFTLYFKRKETGEEIKKTVRARDLMRLMAETNWDYGEPGALFWDRINDWNLMSNTKGFSYAGVNPCAEEPLPAGGSCLLGSINLGEFVKNPYTDKAAFDYDDFSKCVMAAVKALNEVLDAGLPLHPLKEQRDSVSIWRQIGLGIMGLGDMLIKMGVRYGSPEAVKLCDAIAFKMADNAIYMSASLAGAKGAFEKCNIDEIMNTPYFKANTTESTRALVKKNRLRNSQLLTTAPTGTLSTMLDITGGIEPLFALSYTRRTQSLYGKDVEYKVYPKVVREYMELKGIKDENDLPDFFVVSHELDYHERINMQAALQSHIDASISSTINGNNDFTVEQVEDMYMYAYEKGLKGVTFFRDGCKRLGILTETPKKEEEKKEEKASSSDADAKPAEEVSADNLDEGIHEDGLKRGEIIKVSENVIGKKKKLNTGCGSLHCIALFDPKTGKLLETFLSKGSSGGCNNYMIGLSRMISLAARGGIDIYTIADQLASTGACPSYAVRSATKHDTSRGSCCPMAVGNALIDMYKEVQKELKEGKIQGFSEEKKETEMVAKKERGDSVYTGEKAYCPECREPLVFEGGCNVCKNCGWSKCL